MAEESPSSSSSSSSPPHGLTVSLLDYGAGNVRSVRNAIKANGYHIEDITTPGDIDKAQVIIFPGVGSFGKAMEVLNEKGYVEPLKKYLESNRPYLGICLGMQTLFHSSEETPGVDGLGMIPGSVVMFNRSDKPVPHIGWNARVAHQTSPVFKYVKKDEEVYFVHSFHAPITKDNKPWVLTSTTYGDEEFISSVQRGNVVATQFHPEKSGQTGLNVLKGFLWATAENMLQNTSRLEVPPNMKTNLVKRVVVALDVRSNDDGDLVVTKGDQYDVREKPTTPSHSSENNNNPQGRGGVRNLGKPVALAARYYEEGADEIAFLNITSFRQGVIDDLPMLQVLEEASKRCFVPLTVGGGIRSYKDEQNGGKVYSALEVASRYFRAGADKVSIGSDAVLASEQYYNRNQTPQNDTSIEQISHVYGAQAVVISIDPKLVYLVNPNDVPQDDRHVVIPLNDQKGGKLGPSGEAYCWYQCTIKGGREGRDICAVSVARACQALGAGEIMLNCIDMDGQGNGFDHLLMNAVASAVTIPVIASSGAGKAEHFTHVFTNTGVQAALAAGMFHRKEVGIDEVKKHMKESGIASRVALCRSSTM